MEYSVRYFLEHVGALIDELVQGSSELGSGVWSYSSGCFVLNKA